MTTNIVYAYPGTRTEFLNELSRALTQTKTLHTDSDGATIIPDNVMFEIQDELGNQVAFVAAQHRGHSCGVFFRRLSRRSRLRSPLQRRTISNGMRRRTTAATR